MATAAFPQKRCLHNVETSSYACLYLKGHECSVHTMVSDLAKERLISCDSNNRIICWNIQSKGCSTSKSPYQIVCTRSTMARERTLPNSIKRQLWTHQASVNCDEKSLQLGHKEGKDLVCFAGHREGTPYVTLLDLGTGIPIIEKETPTSRVFFIGSRFFCFTKSQSLHNTLIEYNPLSGEELDSIKMGPAASDINSLQFYADEQYLMFTSNGGCTIFDAASNQHFLLHTGSSVSSFDRNGNHLAVGYLGGLTLFNLAERSVLHQLSDDHNLYPLVRIAGEDQIYYGYANDSKVYVFDLKSNSSLELASLEGVVRGFSFDPASGLMCCTSTLQPSSCIKFFEVSSGREVSSMSTPPISNMCLQEGILLFQCRLSLVLMDFTFAPHGIQGRQFLDGSSESYSL